MGQYIVSEYDEIVGAAGDGDEWLTIETPDGPYVWHLGAETTADELFDISMRARILARVPAEDSGFPGEGCVLMHYRDTPHRDLLDKAVAIGNRKSLAAVDDKAVAEYAAAREQIAADLRLAAAQAALDALTPEQLDVIAQELGKA